MRLEQDHLSAPERERRSRHPAPEAALRAALRRATRALLRFRAAVRRRVVPLRALFTGDRTRPDGFAHHLRVVARACARWTAGARHTRLRSVGVGVDGEGVRLLQAWWVRHGTYRALHVQRLDRVLRFPRLRP